MKRHATRLHLAWQRVVRMTCCHAPPDLRAQIIVPTSDTIRYMYLLDKLVACGKHVLCVGETGTGKTLNVANKLLNEMPEEVSEACGVVWCGVVCVLATRHIAC